MQEIKTTYYKTPIGIAKITGDKNGIQSVSVLDDDTVSEELLKQSVPYCLQECVVQLDEYFKEYYFIFDQLGTDECRAFNNFNDAKQKNFELLLMSEWNHAPEVVFGKYIK